MELPKPNFAGFGRSAHPSGARIETSTSAAAALDAACRSAHPSGARIETLLTMQDQSQIRGSLRSPERSAD